MMISEKQLKKISKDLNNYYETEEIDIDLANRIHEHCSTLLNKYNDAINLLDDALSLLDDVHCGDTDTYQDIEKFLHE